jgi:hypothetical protein
MECQPRGSNPLGSGSSSAACPHPHHTSLPPLYLRCCQLGLTGLPTKLPPLPSPQSPQAATSWWVARCPSGTPSGAPAPSPHPSPGCCSSSTRSAMGCGMPNAVGHGCRVLADGSRLTPARSASKPSSVDLWITLSFIHSSPPLQVQFYQVSEAELEAMRPAFAAGHFPIEVSATSFDVAKAIADERAAAEEVATFKVRNRALVVAGGWHSCEGRGAGRRARSCRELKLPQAVSD